VVERGTSDTTDHRPAQMRRKPRTRRLANLSSRASQQEASRSGGKRLAFGSTLRQHLSVMSIPEHFPECAAEQAKAGTTPIRCHIATWSKQA